MTKTKRPSPVRAMSRTDRFVCRQTKCIVIRSERTIQSLSSRKVKDVSLWLAVWKDSLNLPTTDRDKIQMLLISKMKDIPFSGKTGHLLFNEGFCKGLGRRLMWLGAHIFEKSIERRKKRQIHDYRVLQGMTGQLINPNGLDSLSEEDSRVREILNTAKK